MKVQLMIHADKLSRTVTKRDHLWSLSQRWCPLMTRVDSMPSVEYSPVSCPLDKRWELWDLTILQAPRMISMLNPSKELCSWWEVRSKLYQMYHVETLLVLSVSINTWWNREPFLIMRRPTISELWSTLCHQSCVLLLSQRMLQIYQN